MYEIDPKFFDADGLLDVDAACAAGRKAHARTISVGVRHALNATSEAISALYASVGKASSSAR